MKQNHEGEAILSEVEQDIISNETAQPSSSGSAVSKPDGQTLAPLFAMIGESFAPNWKISQDEYSNLGSTAELAIEETWGSLDKIPGWLQLCAVCMSIYIPRMGVPLRAETEKKPEKKHEKKPESTQDVGTVVPHE